MPVLNLAAAAILTAPVAGLAALAILIGGTTDSFADSNNPGLSAGSVCSTSGPLAGMSAAEAQNARVVAATASARAGDRAALIAVMTGLAESGMRVLADPNDPTGNQLSNQGVGHDHDSLGIFQQRASWGTAAQRMDPVASTNLFLDALLHQRDWSSVEPWRAGQDVQRSAFTGVPGPSNNFSPVTGGNYLVQADKAARIVDLFSVSEGQAPPVPTIADWAWLGLRQGRTTVEIQRVTEPVPWSTAVAAGEIIDPGVAAREVTALATLHTTEVGIDMKTVTSVALNLNLEGSPALAHWGFVGVVTYDVVLVSRS